MKAFAKINLSLNITGVREDGYHTLESIFLPIDFYDNVFIDFSEEMIFKSNKSYIKYNDSNTIIKALNAMREEFGIKDNFYINLTKQVPSQAGLGGGSSDGAAMIRYLFDKYDLNPTSEQIKKVCNKVGSDVLFTYYRKPALVKGIGDELEFIDIKDDYYLTLLKPNAGVSTKLCYEMMDLETCPHPDINKLKVALENGEDFREFLGNSMEPAAIKIAPEINEAKKALLDAGAPFALMSGSGSTVFTLSKDKWLIRDVSNKLKGSKYFVRYGKVLNHLK